MTPADPTYRAPSRKGHGPTNAPILLALPENVWVLEIGGRVDLLHEPLGLKHGGEFGP